MVTANPDALEKLMVVQEHDLVIDRCVQHHQDLPERAELVDAHEQVAKIEAEMAVVAEQRHELERQQKRLEDEVAMLEDKTSKENEKLYGGSVTGVKDLQLLQDEIAGLGKRQGLVEDQILEIMELAEPLDTQLASFQQRLDEANAGIADIQGRLAQREAELDAEREAEEKQRSVDQELVPADLLAEYEERRVGRQGVAVARLANRSCQGCFLELSAVELDRMKREADDVLVSCEECGRILVR